MDAFVGAWAQYEATQHAEIENFIYTDAGDDVQQQAADIRSFIEQDVDLIIVNPSERGEQDSLVAPLTEAMDAGIPVVVVNKMVNYSTDTTFNGYVTFVGPDEFQVGCAMTQELITLIDGEGGVLRLDGVNLAPSRETRRNGANAIFDSYPDVNFTEDLPTDLQSTKTIGIVRNSLANQTRGLWAYNGQMALIGEQTLHENGRRLVPVVSDHNIGLARFVLDNDLNASFVRVPSRMGADAVQVALQILNGEQVPHFVAVQAEVLHSSDLEQANLTGPDTGLLGDYDGLPEEFWPESE
jgi:ABC-type sugar transport system substrate-binding protein